MTDSHASADALLTEHFRYTPLSLIDDIINTVNTIVYRALTAVETGLLSTPPATLGFQASDGVDAEEVKRMEVEDGVHRLETLLEATVDLNFDKLEIYALRNILCVEKELIPHVRLAHHKDLQLPLPPSTPTPASIQALREQMQASETLSLALETEAAANSALLLRLKNLFAAEQTSATGQVSSASGKRSGEILSFLAESNASSGTQAPMTENAAFAASQLPALRALLGTLRPTLSQLGTPSDASLVSEIDRKNSEQRTLRRDYVDGEAQRAIRGAVGIASDDDDGADFRQGITENDVLGLQAAIAARRKE